MDIPYNIQIIMGLLILITILSVIRRQYRYYYIVEFNYINQRHQRVAQWRMAVALFDQHDILNQRYIKQSIPMWQFVVQDMNKFKRCNGTISAIPISYLGYFYERPS